MRERVALVFGLSDAMLAKLQRDQHKGSWRDLDPMFLLTRLLGEVEEMQHALIAGAPPSEVLAEAADVANFAAMVADAYGTHYRRKEDA